MRRRAIILTIAYALVSLLLSAWTEAGVCVSESAPDFRAPGSGMAEFFPEHPSGESTFPISEIPCAEADRLAPDAG